MRVAALGFALGVCLLQQQPVLPGLGAGAALCALALLGAFGAIRRVPPLVAGAAVFVAFTALGFGWAAGLAHLRLADRLDPELEGRDIVVSGVVASLPQPFERGVRFDFDVETPATGVPGRISLSWYAEPAAGDSRGAVRAGERWR
ncbi:MAG TPA: DUF4131 domain-containing protein, partial [Burkholderiales bacterium]|nr:DUF4131 domain-containing protein [Burkholderiales bacterium]